MSLSDLLSAIDSEISRLQKARAILAGAGKSAASSKAKSKPRRKRTMSAEGRKRIAEAQRKRWAAQKQSARK